MAGKGVVYKCAPPTPGKAVPALAVPAPAPTPAKATPATGKAATPGQWLGAAAKPMPRPAAAKMSAAAAGVQSPELQDSDVGNFLQVILASSHRQEHTLYRMEETLVGLTSQVQEVQKTAQTNSESLDLLAGRVHELAFKEGVGANLATPCYDYVAPGLVFVLLFVIFSSVWQLVVCVAEAFSGMCLDLAIPHSSALTDSMNM